MPRPITYNPDEWEVVPEEDATYYNPDEWEPYDPFQAEAKPQSDQEKDSWNITRGLKAGALQTAAAIPALGSMAAKAVDKVVPGDFDFGAEKMAGAAQGIMKRAEKYRPDTTFKELVENPTLGGAVDWAMYTIGNFGPSMAVGFGGAGAGAKIGTRLFLQNAIKKGVAKGLTKKAAAKAVTKEAMRKAALRGAQAGIVSSTGALEGSHMYLTDVEKHGVEDAKILPHVALGGVAGLVELGIGGFGKGHMRLIEKFLGKTAKDAAKQSPKAALRYLKEIGRQFGGEAYQELTQEELAILDEAWTATPEEYAKWDHGSKENWLRRIESGLGGGLMGIGGGMITAAGGGGSRGDTAGETTTPSPEDDTQRIRAKFLDETKANLKSGNITIEDVKNIKNTVASQKDADPRVISALNSIIKDHEEITRPVESVPEIAQDAVDSLEVFKETVPEVDAPTAFKLRDELIEKYPHLADKANEAIINTPPKMVFPEETEDELMPAPIEPKTKVAPEPVGAETKPAENVLSDLNPTGNVLAEYKPQERASMKLGKNITTLDKTSGESSDKIITIYRGADEGQKEIVPGDFVTTNIQLAKDYAGKGAVLSKEVQMKDVLDDVSEPLGEEYIYRPEKTSKEVAYEEPYAKKKTGKKAELPSAETVTKPSVITGKELKKQYHSIPNDIIDRLGKIEVSDRFAGEGEWRADTGLKIKANKESLLHEVGHIADNILTEEQANAWEVMSKEKLRKGILGNKPEKIAEDPYSVWENLYTAFSIYHRAVNGETLSATEKSSIKNNPEIYSFINNNLAEGKLSSEVLAEYPDLVPAKPQPSKPTKQKPSEAAGEEFKGEGIGKAGGKEDGYGFEVPNEKYGIYKGRFKDGVKYIVRENMDNSRGGGNPIFDTPEQAKEYIKREKRRDAANKEFRAKQAKIDEEKKRTVQTKKKEYEDVDGFADGLSPLQKGKVLKTLNVVNRFDGKTMTVKSKVKELVNSGAEIRTWQEDVIKPMSRRRYNQASQYEQDTHDKRIKEGGKKNVYSVGGYELGKTAYDYANYLAGIKEAKAEVAKKKTEPTKEEIEAFIKPLHSKFYNEGRKAGIQAEKLNAYGALQINKLVGSKMRAYIDLDAVEKYLKEHPEAKTKPAEKPEAKVEIETTPEGKEVSVDLTKKEESALTPKQQKEYLLAEIDKAIEAEANKILEANPGANLEDTIKLLANGELVGSSEKYTFEVPNDGTFVIYGGGVSAFRKRVKKTFPSTIINKKFKPVSADQRSYAFDTRTFKKILGKKKPQDLKPSDIEPMLTEISRIAKNKEDVGGIDQRFLNYLLGEKISKPVVNAIKKAWGVTPKESTEVREKDKALYSTKERPQYQTVAYTGSPNAYKKASTDFIGTGEGAQAFGWGLYYSDLEDIAKNYAEQLSDRNIITAKVKGLPIYQKSQPVDYDYRKTGEHVASLQETLLVNEHLFKLDNKEDVLEKIQGVFDSEIDGAKADLENDRAYYTERLKVLRKYRPSTLKDLDVDIEANRNLYKVTLHKGKKPSEYTWLDWYDNASKDNFEKIETAVLENKKINIDKVLRLSNLRKGQFYGSGWRSKQYRDKFLKEGGEIKYPTGHEIYYELIRELGSEKQASLFLLRAGIDGIRYPAGSLSGMKSDAKNYVVFDENAVTIEEHTQYATKASIASSDITLSDVRKLFKPYATGISKDGNIWVKLRGGYGFHVKNVQSITADKRAFEIGRGRMKRDGELIAGKFEDDTIEIVKGIGDRWTLAHESEHLSEKAGLITPIEIAALRGTIKRLVRAGKFETSNKKDIGGQEDRAVFIEKELESRSKYKGTVRKVLDKIADFIDSLVNLFTTTSRGVVRQFESGKIFQRGAGKGVTTVIPEYQKTAERFYSQVIKTVKTKMPAKMQASAVVNWLKKQPGIKPAELDWMDVEGMLEGKKAVTKDELVKTLRENEVVVEEVENSLPQKKYQYDPDFDPAIDAQGQTKFSKYQLPGEKENYRELFLTMPNAKDYSWNDGHDEYSDVKNPIVRVRMNERIDSEGSETLFIEEIQKPLPDEQPKMPPFTQKNAIEMGLKRIIRMASEQGFDKVSWTTGQQQADRYGLSKKVDSIYYKKRKNGKYELVVKLKDGRLQDSGMRNISAEELERHIGKEVAQRVIGNEGRDGKGRMSEYRKLSGLDLKVGGGWAYNLYDRMIPQYLKKFGKKYGAEIGTTEIQAEKGDVPKGTMVTPVGGESLAEAARRIETKYAKGTDVHSFTITPELKRMALYEGMPLFSTKKATLPSFVQEYIDKVESEKVPPASKKKETITIPPDKNIGDWFSDTTDIAKETLLHYLPKNQPYSNIVEKVAASPEWFQHPVMKKIVRLFTRNRNEIYHQVFNHLNDATEGGEDVIKTLKNLKHKNIPLSKRMLGKTSKEYKVLLNMLEDGDTNWKRNQNLSFQNQMQQFENAWRKKGATDETISAWKLVRGAYDRGLDLMRSQMEDMLEKVSKIGGKSKIKGIVFGEKSTKGYGKQFLASPDQFDKFRTVTHKTARQQYGLPSTEGVNYIVGMFKNSDQQGVQSINFKKELFDEKSASEWWEEHKDAVNIRVTDAPQIKELKNTLNGALALMDEWRGFYAPRQRTPGDWAVLARNGKRYFREHRGSYLGAQRLAKKIQKQGWKVESIEEVRRLPESIYQDIKSVSVAKALEEASSRLSKKEGLPGELTTLFNEELLEHISDLIKARGYRSSMIHRKKGVVEGYNKDPLERTIVYNNNLASGVAKAKIAELAAKQILGKYNKDGERQGGIDPAVEKRAFDVATTYLKEQLRNIDQTDRLIGLAKAITTFKYLGFNLRSLGVNLTAVITTAPAAIYQYAMQGKGSVLSIPKALVLAGKDYARYMAGEKLKNPKEQAFMEKADKLGYNDPQYTREALGHLQKTHQKIFPAMMDASMYLFGKSEQWNRGTTILAGYRLARKQGINTRDSIEGAKNASDKAHGIYGKATLPIWAQGGNPFAKISQLFYIYSKFGHNYVQMCYDLGMRKHNIKAFTWATLSPLVLAGGAAFPFKDEIFAFFGGILRALGINRDPEKWVWDTIRKNLGGKGEVVARHGITGAMGVDISGSLSIGIGIPASLVDLTGAAGGVVEDIKQAGKFVGERQYGRAVEKVIPRGFENVLRGAREKDTGLVTQRGTRLWDEKGKPYMPTKGETALRVAGFRSAKEATLAERTWESKREERRFADRKSRIYEMYRAYLVKPSSGKHKEIDKLVKEYNKDVKGLNVARIKYKSMRLQAKRMRKPTKRQAGRLK